MPKQTQKNHTPVLLQEVIDTLKPKIGERYLDLTAGYGGHAREIIDRTQGRATLVDRDPSAVEVLRENFTDEKITILHTDFYQASVALQQAGEVFDVILADLGVSSPHLDKGVRGFSINHDGPLDMRMDQKQALDATTMVNTYSEDELVRILKEYGQEPKARQIVRGIIEHRPLKTTHELAQICKKAWPGYSRVHPATRTFQAIRIAVNDELGQLERSLPLWLQLLRPGGRLGVISFHSLEDAVVKRFFQEHGGDRYDAELDVITKRPISAHTNELVFNPRARSARLRVSKRK